MARILRPPFMVCPANVLHLTATTTGAQTVTIQQLTPTGSSITITWGDGSAPQTIANGYTGTLTHAYAGAGTYPITVSNAAIVTAIDLRDAKLGGFNTTELCRSILTYFFVTAIKTSTIRSSDMVNWRPTLWILYSMPAGTYNIASADMTAWRPTTWEVSGMPTGTYNIASADMVNWRPTLWHLYSMPAGTYNIASADMTAWRPTYWRFYSMPAAGSSYTFTSSCMRNWTIVRVIEANDLALLTAVVDTIVADIYAGRAGYTYATPTLNVGGTNQAPSGIYQSVTPPTTGKETIYDLVNDPTAEGFHKWTITYTP